MIPEYLSMHARENVWCVPYQDNQVILDLAHLSPLRGEVGSCKVMWQDLYLPTPQDYYHVYQIGGNGPDRLGLPWDTDDWLSLQTWATQNNAIIDLYTSSGIQLPLSMAWVYRTDTGDFVIAIMRPPANWAPKYDSMVTLGVDPVSIRIYRNAYYVTAEGEAIEQPVVYGGGLMRTAASLAQLKIEVNNLLTRDGLVKLFVNGYWVDNNHLSQLVTGDIVEYVFDGSVERVVDFNVGQLRDFMSQIDDASKYVLHPPKDPRGEILRYRDDVDVYLYTGDTDLTSKGLYYCRNAEDSLRMVTHADYALRVDYVNAYQALLADKNSDLRVQLHIRNAGDRNYLVDEHHRIKRLYAFDDAFINAALIGGDALLPEWTARVLEASLYPAIMRDYEGIPDPNDVAYCYGINACGVLLADSPKAVTVDTNGSWVPVGLQLQAGCTALEYDANGLLIGWRQFAGGERYYVQSALCTLVEFQTGLGDKALDWTQGTDPITVPAGVRYQLYYCAVAKGIPDLVWRPAVAGTHYRIVDGVLTWLVDPNGKTGLMVTDKKFMLYSLDLNSGDGNYHFTITQGTALGDAATLQPKRLAINLNGHWLTEGVNCVVQWPVVYLTSDRYLNATGTQRVTVMGTGFCDPATLTRELPTDVGWVERGVVSVNERYDLRDDRVMHVVVDGATLLTSLVPFAEVVPDGDVTGYLKLRNGLPFMAYPAVVPLREYSEAVNQSLNALEKATDGAVSDYLTPRVPMYQLDGPNPISGFYSLYSPFMSGLLKGLKLGTITTPYSPTDKAAVLAAIQPVVGLLDYDPARLGMNTNYARLRPFPFATNFVTVTERTYKFLEQVNQSYLQGRLDIQAFFRIGDADLYEGI